MLPSWEVSSRIGPILHGHSRLCGEWSRCMFAPAVLVSLILTVWLRVKVVFWRLMIGLFMFMGRKIWSEMTRLVEDPRTYEEAEDVSGMLSLPWTLLMTF